MAETVNISVMAEKISSEIFSKFGWTISGPTNVNTPCEKIDDHQKKTSPTHPTDVAFTYEDPYEKERIYLLTDLKSYATGSITEDSVKKALSDLAKSVDCANVSNKWRDTFANPAENYQIHGLLFVYNHDAGFDKSFNKILRACSNSSLKIPRDRRLYVVGPSRVEYLLNIVNDIEREQGKQNLPHWEKIPFLYPDRITRLSTRREATAATIELLLGPILLIPYSFEIEKSKERKEGIHFYYEGPGSKFEEFTFIFDFCFKHQLVRDGSKICLRLPNADDKALKHFETAKDVFASAFYEGHSVARLEQFEMQAVNRVVQKFTSDEIGMERRS
ncbi:MAG: hypothetical protein NTV51_10190 [Verrucomicrobia bacterium]|nr:hypothetical protein [Verrucomicrobiota bacterium]